MLSVQEIKYGLYELIFVHDIIICVFDSVVDLNTNGALHIGQFGLGWCMQLHELVVQEVTWSRHVVLRLTVNRHM